MEKLELEEFYRLRDIIYSKSGLFFDEKKLYFVEKRAEKRMLEGGYNSFQDYYRALKFESDPNEFWALVESLTTNETYFYRHIPQMESFVEEALPLILQEKRKAGDYQLNLWSAACSSGEEIYTIAIMLKENIPDLARWKINLLATDLDRKVLAKAQEGIYDSRSIKDVPRNILSRYFKPLNNGLYQLHREIVSMVEFRRMNLVDRFAMRQERQKDFIFCRNVLIYFDDASRKMVINFLYDALNKNGFIFLGHSESVGRLSAAFRLVKFKKSLSYQK
ncbi:MAG: protein-glutamate O-methyltransferase CheR [SAR324 cluster bacterium]|nr:protein-glutamate O-methyltransferase CheR [SAR324 cluster bacterium]